MLLGRVVGRVWSTVKNPSMEGLRFLILQPLTPELTPTGRRIIVSDAMGAGAGELVYCVRGKEASFPFLPAEPAVDMTIVGIVDSVHVKQPEAPAEAPAGEAPAAARVPKRKGKKEC